MREDAPSAEREQSIWKHPFVLALVPAIAGILIAVITIRGSSDPQSRPAPPPTRSSVDIAHRIERDLDAYEDGWSVAFEGPLPATSQLPSNRTYVSLLEWAVARGAVDVRDSHLRLYLENNGADRVTIRAIRAKVVERLAPVSRTFLRAPSAGANELIQLQFDLDSGDIIPASTVVSAPSAPTTRIDPFFSKNNVTLDPGETIDMQLHVSTRTCFCRYRFELEVVRADSTVTLEVGDNAGRPFAITAQSESYVERYFDGVLACQKPGLFRGDASGKVDCSRSV